MNARLAITRGAVTRRVSLADYLDAPAEERAHASAYRWIKDLRHIEIGGESMRARFTVRGDSLWWFTEIYLHKERAVLTLYRAIFAIDALLRTEHPERLQWLGGDDATALVVRARAGANGVAVTGVGLVGMRMLVARQRLTLRGWALHLAARARRGPAPALTKAPLVAFVHRAFVTASESEVPGERYLGRLLTEVQRQAGAGSVRAITLGPQRNFRLRRWWDPLLRPPATGGSGIETFPVDASHDSARSVWHSRRRWRRALWSSTGLRRHSVIEGVDCWPIIDTQLTGVAWLQWPWSAWAMDLAGAALDALTPTACLTYAEAGGWGRALALECRRRNLPLVGVQHGFIYRHWLNYRHEADEMQPDPAHPQDRGFPTPALTLLFDSYAASHLLTQGRFAPDTLKVVGSPERDDLVRTALEITPEETRAARASAGAAGTQHLVLCATKFSEAHRILPALADAMRDLPDAHLAIKPHPAETPSLYDGLRSDRVSVLPVSAPLAPLLAAARTVVTVNSTVAIDALAIGVPALTIGLPNNLTPFVDAGAMLGADDRAAMATALKRLLIDEPLRASLLAAGRAMLGGAPSGGAARLSAETVLDLARAAAPESGRSR